MLALEILKRIYINNPDTRFQRNNIDINFTIHDFSNVNEAIKELEALENRSCDSCKFIGYFSPHEILECQNADCNFFGSDVDFSDSCNKWESK